MSTKYGLLTAELIAHCVPFPFSSPAPKLPTTDGWPGFVTSTITMAFDPQTYAVFPSRATLLTLLLTKLTEATKLSGLVNGVPDPDTETTADVLTMPPTAMTRG